MPLDMRTHKYEDRGGQTVLTKLNPYIRLKERDKGTVFLQKGRIYDPGGGKVDPIPDWVWTAVDRIDPKYLDQLGFTPERIENLKGGTLAPEPDLPPDPLTEAELEDVPNRLLTSEEASDMDFPALRAYASEHGVSGRAKEDLIRKLAEEGWIQ